MEQKSQHIGSLKTKNEGLTADKEQLTIDLHERENELRMEREHKKEEQKARLIAEKKNELYEKKEELEKKLENLRDEIYPWKEKRLQSFKNKEIFMTILPIIVLMVVLSFIQLIWKEEYRSFEDSSYSFWTIALLFLIALICSTSYSTEKRREARREKAYKAWEAKHENAEYGRLQEKIKEVKDEITTCKNLPHVALTGGYTISNPNVFNGFQKKFSGVWNVGVLVQVPVWNWFDGTYKVRAAKATSQIAQMNLDDTSEKIHLQITQSQFKVKEAKKKLNMAQKNIKSAEENLRCANLGFKEGVMDITDVMTAQTAWQKAQSQKIDAEIDVKLTQIGLNKALGILQ